MGEPTVDLTDSEEAALADLYEYTPVRGISPR